MKFIKVLFIGILFGIIMTKSEAISWYRIQEMFRFQAFHMYGIMGSALLVAMLVTQLIKRAKLKNTDGEIIAFTDKKSSFKRYMFGGIIFGMGWALTGACPGPLYTLIGNGFSVFIVVVLSAIFGTFLYGAWRDKLPH